MQHIAIDVGYGYTKGLGAGESHFPSEIAGGRSEWYPTLRQEKNITYVDDENREWYVGATAELGKGREGVLGKAPTSLVFRILLESALALVTDDGTGRVVTGLPISLFLEDGTRKLVEQYLTGHKIMELRVDGEELTRHLTIEKCEILPQPLGSFLDYMLDDHGRVVPEEEKLLHGRVGVIDVGFRTCDYLLLDDFVVHPEGTFSRTSGFYHVVHRIMPDRPEYEADLELRRRDYKLGEQEYKNLAREISSYAEANWLTMPSRTPKLILLSGGAAPILAEYIKLPGLTPVESPVMANVRGYLKYANRQWTREAAAD